MDVLEALEAVSGLVVSASTVLPLKVSIQRLLTTAGTGTPVPIFRDEYEV